MLQGFIHQQIFLSFFFLTLKCRLFPWGIIFPMNKVMTFLQNAVKLTEILPWELIRGNKFQGINSRVLLLNLSYSSVKSSLEIKDVCAFSYEASL